MGEQIRLDWVQDLESGAEAIATTRAARRDTIENERQEAYVNGWDWPPRVALA